MKTALKWIGIVVGGLAGLILIAGVGLYAAGASKTSRVYDIARESLTPPTGAEALARGQVLAEVSSCTACHTASLGGESFINEPVLAILSAPNLTSGLGGIGGQYTDADWERAIRHGVRPDGTGLIIMASQHFNYYSDEDLGALIAYLKSVPPVDNGLPARQVGPMGNILLAFGAFPFAPDLIDHSAAHTAATPTGATAAHGEYLTQITACTDCHGAGFVGRTPEEAGQGAPAGPNLTPGGELGGWTEADFFKAMREGVKPTGTPLSADMPWTAYAKLADEELSAIWLYLQSLPPVEPK
jgi:cytochrome c553